MIDDALSSLSGDRLLYFVTCFVSIGVFLFGYDQGVMSGIITGPYFVEYFNRPSPAMIGTMVAVLELGALASSLAVGRLGDHWGRKKTICIGASVFVAGGFLQTFALSMDMLIAGRVTAGVGVGMLSTIVPVYQSEVSPPHNRGKLACIEFTGNIIGYAASVWVDYFCSFIESNQSWRLPLLIQCLMGLLLALGSRYVVETPRWLISKSREQEGFEVLLRLHAADADSASPAHTEFDEIKAAVEQHRAEGEHSYAWMWRHYKRRVLTAMSAQMLAQLNGINVISYYAPLVFEQAGWVGRDAILMAGINGIVYVLATVPPWFLVERLGRRRMLMSGGVIMAAALAMTAGTLRAGGAHSAALVVLYVVIYNAFFGYSWGPIPWLYPPEILPLSVRSKGASLSTATNWAFNFLVGELTPMLQETMGWSMYLLPASFCAVSVLTVYLAYPETKGKTLEEMDSVFRDA